MSKLQLPLASHALGILYFLLILSGRTTITVGATAFDVRLLLVLSIYVLLIMTKRLTLRRRIGVVPALIVIWLATAMFTALWSQTELRFHKLEDLLYLAVLVGLGSTLFRRDKVAFKTLLLTASLAGVVYSGLALLSLSSTGNLRGSVGFSGPNVATRVIFIGMLSFWGWNYYRPTPPLNVGIASVTLLYLAGIISVGSRGGIIGASIALTLAALTLLPSVRLTKPSRLRIKASAIPMTIMLLASVAAIGMRVAPAVSTVFESRIISLVINRLHFAGRDVLYTLSIDAIQEHPVFGLGLGGYEAVGIDMYPHNIVLELLLDGGLLLLGSFVPLIGASIWLAFRSKGVARIVAIIPFYALVVGMFSGDYYDTRYFFVFLLLTFYASRQAAYEANAYETRNLPINTAYAVDVGSTP